VVGGVLGVGFAVPARAADDSPPAPSEYEVKAAFLYNFLSFVDWPDGAVPAGTFTIAVVGRDPFGAVLDDVVSGEQHEGRRIVVRRVARARDADGAQIAFLGVTDAQLAGALADLAGKPVLTVGEGRDFAKRGGIIQLRMQGGRVRFDVNARAATVSGLKISSHLLKLAVTVHDGPPAPEGTASPGSGRP
jgi:hypothetical protein